MPSNGNTSIETQCCTLQVLGGAVGEVRVGPQQLGEDEWAMGLVRGSFRAHVSRRQFGGAQRQEPLVIRPRQSDVHVVVPRNEALMCLTAPIREPPTR